MHPRIVVRCFLLVSLFLVAGVLVPPVPARADPRVGPDIPIHVLDNIQHLPAVAYNPVHREYLVVWHNEWGGGGRDIYARRVSAGGEVLSWFAVSVGPNDRAQPSVAYDAVHDRYLVAWIYDVAGDGSNWDVYGRYIPWSGPDGGLGEFPICEWPSSQWTPQVVHNAHPQVDEFLVVWANTPALVPSYVSARRVFADGSGFPPGDGFTVASHSTENRVNPDVAYNLARNEYLVVFSRDTVDILGQRVDANGNLLGGEFGIAGWPATEQHPAVAACHTADQYFVAWQSLVGTAPNQDYDIYGRYVTGDGTPQDVKHVYGTTANDEDPDVACNPRAGHYLVTWQEQYSSTTGPYGVSGRILHSDKTMASAFGIVGPFAGIDREDPAVAAGPPGFLVTWAHDRAAGGWIDIHGSLVWPAAIYVPMVVRQ